MNYLKAHSQLLFLLPPLLLYFFASLLFELSVDPTNSFTKQLWAVAKASTAPDLKHVLGEVRARYAWLASALVNIVVPIAALMFSVATLRSCVTGSRLAGTVMVGVLLCAGTLGHLALGVETQSALYEVVFAFTYRTLTQSELFSDHFLRLVYAIILIINILAAVTPIFVLLAACGTAGLPAAPGNGDPRHLAIRARRLKEVISVGSAFLVVGVFHMSMWLKWTASLIVTDPAIQSEISGVAWSISAYWGVAFTLVLIVTYVPPAVYLHNRARALITEGANAMGPEEAGRWLDEQGLSFTLGNQLAQCMTLLAPFLAAPLSELLSLT